MRLARAGRRLPPAANRSLLRPDRPRSLKNKLAILFFAITAVAFAVVYIAVVPQLTSNLEEQRLDDLRLAADGSSTALEEVMGRDITASELDKLVRGVADGANAQITLLGIQRSATGGADSPLQFYVISDSRAGQRVERDFELAASAIRLTSPQTGLRHVRGAGRAQVAVPLFYRGRAEWVALFSRSLGDVADTVGLIRTRVLAAGAVALIVALVGGYGIAQALSRRVRRLEAAARRLAAGESPGPLPIDSRDELGELTRAFNEMQEQLDRVERVRRDFIANASHELRTPIFSLAGFVELLLDEQLDGETRLEFLGQMREQVERLQKLSVELLDLSRLDAGSLELHRESVDLSELARAVSNEFAPLARSHRSELELALPEDSVDADCDPERTAQIMRILLDNALRHTPEGTQVTVSAERLNGAAELTVADAGPGLDPTSATEVFERFYTADAARGSGLGLAIAKELAERMEGTIRLHSRPGRTAFTLGLPVSGGETEPPTRES